YDVFVAGINVRRAHVAVEELSPVEAPVVGPVEAAVGHPRVDAVRFRSGTRYGLDDLTLELVVHHFRAVAIRPDDDHAFLGTRVQPRRLRHGSSSPRSCSTASASSPSPVYF